MAQQATPPPDHSSTQASAKPPAAKPTPAEDNAFPEAQSEAAAKQAAADQSADEKASGAGSAVAPNAPGEAGSSSRDKLSGLDLLGDNDSRIANGAGGVILDPKLSAQDLKVGQQYMQMGDYPGAYSRFKEACAVNPDNLDAVFYLAEAARKTAHLDESAQNYKLYLQVQPEGSKAKAARKALAQLQGK
jgi:tetratricopeptide (TPR) repeat protein